MKSLTKHWRVKDGSLIHDGGCNFWELGVCTCGLIRQLMPRGGEAGVLYADFWDDRAKHDAALDKLRQQS